MFRLYFSIFWSRPVREGGGHHGGDRGGRHREAPFTMKLPLVILALGAVFAGFVPFSRLVTLSATPLAEQGVGYFWVFPVAAALIGLGIAGYLYRVASDRPERAAASVKGLYQFAYHKFYIDEVYSFITKRIIFNWIGRPAAWFDRNVVDGLMNGLAMVTARMSAAIKGFQSGKVQDYTLYFFIGIAGLAVIFIYIYT
jgi:NADH-quinone oxidoreductase subunit L